MITQPAAGLVMAATAIHVGGCIMCIHAARASARSGQSARKPPARQLLTGEQGGWIACAAGFAGMAVVRLFGAEEFARNLLRPQLVLAGEYEQRWDLQSLLAAAIGIAAVLLLAVVLQRKLRHRLTTRARLLLTAQLALLGYIPVVALRVLSWHQTDRLLYAGPVRLNWLLELVLALVPMAMAGLYLRQARQHAEGTPRHG